MIVLLLRIIFNTYIAYYNQLFPRFASPFYSARLPRIHHRCILSGRLEAALGSSIRILFRKVQKTTKGKILRQRQKLYKLASLPRCV